MGDKCREIVTQPGQHKNVYWVQDNNGRQAHIAHTKRTHTQVAQRHKTCANFLRNYPGLHQTRMHLVVCCVIATLFSNNHAHDLDDTSTCAIWLLRDTLLK